MTELEEWKILKSLVNEKLIEIAKNITNKPSSKRVNFVTRYIFLDFLSGNKKAVSEYNQSVETGLIQTKDFLEKFTSEDLFKFYAYLNSITSRGMFEFFTKIDASQKLKSDEYRLVFGNTLSLTGKPNYQEDKRLTLKAKKETFNILFKNFEELKKQRQNMSPNYQETLNECGYDFFRNNYYSFCQIEKQNLDDSLNLQREKFILLKLCKGKLSEINKLVDENTNSHFTSKTCKNFIVSVFLRKNKSLVRFYLDFDGRRTKENKKIDILNYFSADDLFYFYNYLNKLLIDQVVFKSLEDGKNISKEFQYYCKNALDEGMAYFDGNIDFDRNYNFKKTKLLDKMFISKDEIVSLLYTKSLQAKEKSDKLNEDNLFDARKGIYVGKYSADMIILKGEQKREKTK